MDKAKLLIVDDDLGFTKDLSMNLSRIGYDVTTVSDAVSAVKIFDREEFDVVLLDLKLHDISGMEVLRTFRRRKPLVQVIVLAGDVKVDMALQAMQFGAFDYVMKTLGVGKLTNIIGHAVERKKIAEGNVPQVLTESTISSGLSAVEGAEDSSGEKPRRDTFGASDINMEGCVLLALSTFRRSEKAIEVAIEQAKENNKLSILHVADINLARYFIGVEHGITTELKELCEEDVLERHEKAGRLHIQAIVERASREGLEVATHSQVGRFAFVCLELAEAEKPSLIVTTRSQRPEWVRKFFGAPVDELIAKAKCPVLVV